MPLYFIDKDKKNKHRPIKILIKNSNKKIKCYNRIQYDFINIIKILVIYVGYFQLFSAINLFFI